MLPPMPPFTPYEELSVCETELPDEFGMGGSIRHGISFGVSGPVADCCAGS